MAILSGTARLAGITGWPVSHSRSPRLHGFWLQRHGIDGAYVPLGIRPEAFALAVRGLVAAGFAGANVTAPHKLAAFEICTHVEGSARRAGAVNTLVFQDGRITGRNTDGIGFLANLRAYAVDPAAGPALVLGAGGAARAVVGALQDEGVPVTIANRTRERADALALGLGDLKVIDWTARSAALSDHALLVNTTSLGMKGQPPLDLDLSRLSKDAVVNDVVYVPLETPLLAAARARGNRCIDGLGMLLHQGRMGFKAWFGTDVTVSADQRRAVAADLIGSSS
jgi:shikimate dehydrogenase